MGDELEPCQPPGILAEINRIHGRPCPRIELDPANAVAWQLFQLVIRDDARAMFGPFFEALTVGATADERAALVRRVLETLNDQDVFEIMHPKPAR